MTRQGVDRPRPKFLTHPIFTQTSFGAHHPLSIVRQGAVIELVRALGWIEPDDIEICPLATLDQLAAFHAPDYLAAFAGAAGAGVASVEARARYNLGSMECPIFPGVWDRARATVGGAMRAAELALAGHVAFHPAGGTHHGRRDRASGFCYFNDPVFAILRLLDAGLSRVLYVDLDAHHGDGVEDAFAADPRVMTMSIHEAGRWPGTGALEDRRDGRARNMPVPRGLNDSEFRLLVDNAVVPLGQAFRPQAVVIECGVDALKGDPLSAMQISNSALWDAVLSCVALAPRAVVLGGGGYNPWTLARGWAGLWGRLNGLPMPKSLPEAARSVLVPLSCDLVDDEDRDPAWLSTLVDPPNGGAIRAEVRDIVRIITAQ